MLYRLFVRLLVSIFTILLIAYFVPGISVDGFVTALTVAVVLGAVNMTLRPLLFLLTLPITLLTLGLFTFVLNALLLWLVAGVVPGFEVSSFLSALLGSVVMALVTGILHRVTD